MNQAQANLWIEQWSTWLFGQSGNTDTASDPTGARVMTQNQGKDPWFIPGTWGAVSVGARRITVPQGTRLFVVAASSHATPTETPAQTPGQPTDQELLAHVRDIDGLWFNTPTVRTGQLNGPYQDEALTRAVTGVYQATIHQANGYVTATNGVAGQNLRIASIGRVCLYAPGQGQWRIIIAGQSPRADNMGPRGEREYNVQVNYEVTVQ